MANNFKILFSFAFLINSIICTDSNLCVQKNSCLCEFSEFSKIDLSQVFEVKNESLYLEDELADITYYFHGCMDGAFNATAHGVNTTNSTEIYKSTLLYKYVDNNVTKIAELGNSSQIHFNNINAEGTSYELIFKNGSGPDSGVAANVRLICDPASIQPMLKVIDRKQFALISSHACIITHHPGMSTGSVLIIIFIISIAIYLICGGLLMYFVRGARGIELIPNIDFWRQLPGLVKDGIIFLFSGCNPHTISTPETYDRI